MTKTLSDFFDAAGRLQPAEEALARAAPEGDLAMVGAGARPDKDGRTQHNAVRAAFIRYLALGGCAECRPHEKGVRLKGAWIEGALDFEACRLEQPLALENCYLSERVVLRDAKTRTLSFDGSHLNADNREKVALYGQRLFVDGALHFRGGFEADGEIALESSRIEGNLWCADARFRTRSRNALRLTGAHISGGLFFRPPKDGPANYKMFEDGSLILTDVRARSLVDDEKCWPEPGELLLDGFVYDRIGWASPTDYRSRRRWLLLQTPKHLGENFRTQPWEQLEKSLTIEGKALEARRIGVEKERRKRRAGEIAWYLRPMHWLYGLAVGYGYFTARAMLWSAIFILIGALLFSAAWRQGAMVPASEVMLDDPEWKAVQAAPNPAELWIQAAPGRDYASFDPLLYSFDVFIPIVSVEQEPAWAPSTTRGEEVLGEPLGRLAALYRVFHELMGYILSAFAIAGAARLVREGGR